MSSISTLEFYIKHYFDLVPGWTDFGLTKVIELLSSLQNTESGGVVEIGVDAGRFLLLLNAAAPDIENSFAVLIQRENEESQKRLLLSNLIKYDKSLGDKCSIIDELNYEDKLLSLIASESIRYFSINGLKDSQSIHKDLVLAAKLINKDGIVFLNDIGNIGYMSVYEGLIRFIDNERSLIPFAVGFNKLYMAKAETYEKYYDLLTTSSLFVKSQEFLGRSLAEIG